MDDVSWAVVDDYLIETLISEDDALADARRSSPRTAMVGPRLDGLSEGGR